MTPLTSSEGERERDLFALSDEMSFVFPPFPLITGDIDIIAAMGDSLTAATGATSTAFMDLFIDNRGLSWCIGGQWSYRNSTTLPNILKEFNPNLFGYSVSDSYPFHLGSQFNVAEIGGVSADMVFMARTLINRIRSDPRVDFKRHWKMLTISIGESELNNCPRSKADLLVGHLHLTTQVMIFVGHN